MGGDRVLGKMAHANRLVYFGISGFEQKTFGDVNLVRSIQNLTRRIRGRIFRIAPGFILGYGAYYYCITEHDKASRKNPADYANDK